jgi:hypothetical protein
VLKCHSPGLSLTALHKPHFHGVITAELFDKYTRETAATQERSTHALTIIARILKDEDIEDTKYLGSQRIKVYSKYADVIRKYVDQWDVETADPKVVSRKFEELVWMNVAIYGTCGFKEGQEFKNEFFL